MKIRVINNKQIVDMFGAFVYIGRPNPLGNPFVIGRDGDRDSVCDKFKVWFPKQLKKKNSKVRREFDFLVQQARITKHDLHLVCFCKPKRCHGATIKKHLKKALLKDPVMRRTRPTKSKKTKNGFGI